MHWRIGLQRTHDFLFCMREIISLLCIGNGIVKQWFLLWSCKSRQNIKVLYLDLVRTYWLGFWRGEESMENMYKYNYMRSFQS